MFGFDQLAVKVVAAFVSLTIAFSVGYYKGHSAVQAKFDQYKAEVVAAADAQAQKAKEVEARNQRLFQETKNAYDTKLTALRSYYSMRIAQSGGTMPRLPVAPEGVVSYSADNLPSITTLAAQCAETTLTLYTLQNWVQGAVNNQKTYQ